METVILFSNQVICDKLIKCPGLNMFSWEKPSQAPPPTPLKPAGPHLLIDFFPSCQNKGSVRRHVSALKRLGNGLRCLSFEKCNTHAKINMKQRSLTVTVLELLLITSKTEDLLSE